MQKIFTLILGLVLLCPASQAQYSQNFETSSVLGTNCLDHTQFISTIGSSVSPIHGTGSAYTNPPTSGTEVRSLTTPFLVITGEPLTISFYYQLSNKLGGQATRVIEVGLVDRTGAFTVLDRIDMDKTSTADEAPQFYEETFTGLTPGVQRVGFRITGNTGDGNSRMIYDDLYVSASPFYGPVVNCNTPPQVVNDNYFSDPIVPVSGNVLTGELGADSDINGEALKAALVTPPADSLGTLTFNSDGTFTFTPAPDFKGGLVIFTYRATDDGYPAANSGLATVTISYKISTLPVQLTQFAGKLVNGKSELSWNVAENETVAHFVVERSADGRNFTAVGSVAATEISGDEAYHFTDPLPVQGRMIYRLQMVDREGMEEYSRMIVLQGGTSGAGNLRVLGNPGTTDLLFSYTAAQETKISIRVYNAAGQLLQARSRAVRSGVNQLGMESSLAAGSVYILEVVSSEGARSVVKFRK